MSMFQSVTKAVGQVANAAGALAGVVCKLTIAADRATDAAYSYADTFVATTEIRNSGTLEDAKMDEAEHKHDRTIRQMKLDKALASIQKEMAKK
jgi:hypothetical protein